MNYSMCITLTSALNSTKLSYLQQDIFRPPSQIEAWFEPKLAFDFNDKGMQPYKNLAGNSGILAYIIGKTFIRIKFKDGIYNYTYSKPGKKWVEEMKKLAEEGQGLRTFISRYVKENYASKNA